MFVLRSEPGQDPFQRPVGDILQIDETIQQIDEYFLLFAALRRARYYNNVINITGGNLTE